MACGGAIQQGRETIELGVHHRRVGGCVGGCVGSCWGGRWGGRVGTGSGQECLIQQGPQGLPLGILRNQLLEQHQGLAAATASQQGAGLQQAGAPAGFPAPLAEQLSQLLGIGVAGGEGLAHRFSPVVESFADP